MNIKDLVARLTDVSDDFVWSLFHQNPETLVNLYPRMDDSEIIEENQDEFWEWFVENYEDDITEHYTAFHTWWQMYGDAGFEDVLQPGWKLDEDHSPDYLPYFLDWLDTLHPEPREKYLMRLIDPDELPTIVQSFLDDNPDAKYEWDDDDQIMMWFGVPNWLAEKLESKHEAVLYSHGECYWGRRGSGYALTTETALVEILAEMNQKWGVEDGSESN